MGFVAVAMMVIAEALTKQGFGVKKGEIVMPNGPLKTIGDFPLTLNLHTDVKAQVTVSVLGEHV
jgi:large subunit ribosomal protein L9